MPIPGLYCTDVAKSIQSPILHVNGDDAEAVVFCARMAAEFRMRFATDIVLDIVCYRRHGHNETDEPAFTQPLMYRAINQTKTTRTLYAERLAVEGVVTAAEAQSMWDEFAGTLEDANAAGKSYKPNKADWLEGHWSGLSQADPEAERVELATAVSPATLKRVGAALTRVPAGFEIHPRIARQLEAKQATLEFGRRDRLDDRRSAGVRVAAAGRSPGAAFRRGQSARHLQPAPRGADRPGQPA